ncbi:MAG: hypothetical protein CXX81_06880 [Methanobacteriota archaeon]|nr:MAG: hypothetical protein CXX81_27965 [Euryarchaeota archaeon]HIA24930.1 hypothetical protein [Candidatus Poseidoniales archaeon]PXY74924.1 MAG: hypothetical protein CXX81_19975 [Euryarchaeota archaeon]PXY78605.1 MAG: hypothetical protein CXX81_06880 [Euryarchaeota archaeon]HIB41039.1 hypothetical protein [Candidatus Poseidoniales archaeon]
MSVGNWTKIVVLSIASLMLPMAFAAPTPVASAGYPQGIFGGISIEVSNLTNASTESSMADYPSIAEVYTASWCENCVLAEEGLYTAISEASGDTMTLTFHRAIGEVEDPFGVEAADHRWEARYGDASKDTVSVKRAPPTIIINGETMHAGSGGLDGEQLKPYYAESLAKPSSFSQKSATSSLSWSSEDMATGTLTWNLEAGDWLPESTTSLVFVVEASATFEEGSNGIGDYLDVVRDMIELNGNSGSMNYTLPLAWDGEDLSLVLVHQWGERPVVACCDVSPPEDGGLFGLPSIGVLWVVVGLAGAALVANNHSRKE